MYRLAKVHKGMKIHELVQLVEDNINNSPRKDNNSPNDLVGGKVKKKTKGKKSKVPRLALKVGDRVRVMKAGIRKKEMYKSYQGTQWGKRVYTVTKAHGKTYFTLSNGKKHHISELNKVGHETVEEPEQEPEPEPKPKPETQKAKPKKKAKKKPKWASIDISEKNIIKGGRRSSRRTKKKDYSKYY